MHLPPLRSSPRLADPASARREDFTPATQQAILSALTTALAERHAFVALTGPAGAGKTILLNRAIGEFKADDRRHVIGVSSPLLEPLGLRQLMGQITGKPADELSGNDLEQVFETLTMPAAKGADIILVIDDAQTILPDAIEYLTLVSSMLRSATGTTLQIVLVGRPELWTTLHATASRHAATQIAARIVAGPLTRTESRAYVTLLLGLRPEADRRPVTRAAMDAILRHGEGLPGRMERLLERAASTAPAPSTRPLTPEIVDEAAAFLADAPAALPRARLAPARQDPLAPRSVAAPAAIPQSEGERSRNGLLAFATAAFLLVSGIPWRSPMHRDTVRSFARAPAAAEHAAAASAIVTPTAPFVSPAMQHELRLAMRRVLERRPSPDLPFALALDRVTQPRYVASSRRPAPPIPPHPPVRPKLAVAPRLGVAPSAALSAPLLAALLERGSAMLALGDFAAARLLYERAAAAGSAVAATAAGTTYDPGILASRHAAGIQADPLAAADWYRRALAMGDPAAAGRLRQLKGRTP